MDNSNTKRVHENKPLPIVNGLYLRDQHFQPEIDDDWDLDMVPTMGNF